MQFVVAKPCTLGFTWIIELGKGWGSRQRHETGKLALKHDRATHQHVYQTDQTDTARFVTILCEPFARD